MHNDAMRATLRLVAVWVSVTIVIVVLGWSGLRSALHAALDGDADGFSALDASVLARGPGSATPRVGGKPPTPRAQPSATPTARPLPAHRRAVTVTPRLASRTEATPPPTPSAAPSPQPSVAPSVPANPATEPSSPPVKRTDVGEVTMVDTMGGTVWLRTEDTGIAVERALLEPGYRLLVTADHDGSVVVQFVGVKHVSTVRAELDEAGNQQTAVEETETPPAS